MEKISCSCFSAERCIKETHAFISTGMDETENAPPHPAFHRASARSWEEVGVIVGLISEEIAGLNTVTLADRSRH